MIKSKKNKRKIFFQSQDFEIEVTKLLMLAGYKNVKWQQRINETIFDCIAEYNTPTGSRAIIVEVKNYYLRCGPDVVDRMAGLLQRIPIKVDHVLIISKKGFTSGAHAVASKYLVTPILLKTPTELIMNQLDFNNCLTRLLDLLVDDDITKWYVPVPIINEGRKKYTIDEYIQEWITEPTNTPLFILGGFGMGKTTFAKRLVRTLAINYIKKQDTPIPIMLKLRDCGRGLSLTSLLTSSVVNELGVTGFSIAHFKWLAKQGVFLLILDGFDEMTPGATDEEIIANISEIGELLQYCKYSIITCRPEFFQSDLDRQRIISQCTDNLGRDLLFKMIELDYWGPDDIKEYIQKRVGNPKEIIELINKVHDLRDLSKRPVLMNMICLTIPELIALTKKTQENCNITCSKLYQTYINKILERDIKKRIPISIESRLIFMMLLGGLMTRKKIMSVTLTDIDYMIGHTFLPHKEELIDATIRETVARTLLIRERGNNYKFSHSSFLEYFYSKLLVDWLLLKLNYIANINHYIDYVNITEPTVLFTTDMILEGDNFQALIDKSPEIDSKVLRYLLVKLSSVSDDIPIAISKLDEQRLLRLIILLCQDIDSTYKLIAKIWPKLNTIQVEWLYLSLLRPPATTNSIPTILKLISTNDSIKDSFISFVKSFKNYTPTQYTIAKFIAFLHLRRLYNDYSLLQNEINIKKYDVMSLPRQLTNLISAKHISIFEKEIKINEITFKKLWFDDIYIKNIIFNDVQFYDSTFVEHTFINCKFFNCTFDGCKINSTSFDKCALHTIKFIRSNIKDVDLSSSIFTFKNEKEKINFIKELYYDNVVMDISLPLELQKKMELLEKNNNLVI